MPDVLTVSPIATDEGQLADLTATFSDANAGQTHTAKVFWGDGSHSVAMVNQAEGTVTASHVYADNRTYTVRVEVTDNGGATGSREASAVIANVAPTIAVTDDQATDVGTPLSLDVATFTDPGFTKLIAGTMETFTATIDWGDGSGATPATVEVVQGTEGTAGTTGTQGTEGGADQRDDFGIAHLSGRGRLHGDGHGCG